VSEIVAVDIGGTHARFAIAEVEGGRVASLGEACTLKTAEHASLETAWEDFSRQLGRPLPDAAGIAVAGPIQGEVLKLTNNPWVIRPAWIERKLGVGRYALVNDFGAVAHAVAQLGDGHFRHLCGPEVPLPDEGVITIVGPGTGLGVAQLLRRGGHYHVIETEGGHIDFAPVDALEDKILAQLRKRYRRVSVERVASGMGMTNLYEALAAIEGRPVAFQDEKELWRAAMACEDSLAAAALDRFCLALGAVAGDIALAQGAGAVVIAGGLGLRLADHFPKSGFRDRFIAKGRFERRMDEMPVKLIAHPQPGLFGAAAAFAAEHGE
jgi:glucokinase